jgi:hypothetical protein
VRGAFAFLGALFFRAKPFCGALNVNSTRLLASLALVGFGIACARAEADILVRHCDTPTLTACAVSPIWVAPPSAINVQVNRTGAPFVKLSDVQPSERIATCYNDPAIQAGSTAKCTKTVPNRTDQWELKSTLYPPAQLLGQITLTWDAVTVDTQQQPFSGTAGYLVSRQQDVCLETSADPRCGTMPWITEDVGNVTSKVFAGVAGRWCFRVQGYIAGGQLGAISVPDADDCATAAQIQRLPGPANNVKATAP